MGRSLFVNEWKQRLNHPQIMLITKLLGGTLWPRFAAGLRTGHIILSLQVNGIVCLNFIKTGAGMA